MTSLVFRASSKIAKATQRIPVPQKQTKKNLNHPLAKPSITLPPKFWTVMAAGDGVVARASPLQNT